MQPLTLHIEGLHSFRAPARIDLDRLGQHGLFGIFGPTGSGKSTLLDAMTLALYGQIDRLTGRSRRGIIHNASKRAEVRFRFGVGEQIWEAQRAYRKDKHGNAVRVHSRLAEVVDGRPEVVADKEREVNARVERLLGLSAQDFMRAVVLPQGRFMQFLQLQGSDRRRMLQRIFHLEPFGEGLRNRVKREATQVESRLQHVLGELEGLGAASPEDLAAAARTVDTTAKRLQELDQLHAAERERVDRLTRAFAHQTRLNEAIAKTEDHKRDLPERTAERAAIERAKQVRPVLRHHAELIAADTDRDAATAKAAAADGARATARARQVAALERRNTLLQDRERPVELRARREALQQAVRAQDQLAQTTTRLRTVTRRRSQLQRRAQDESRKLQEAERAVRDHTEALAGLRQDLASRTVPIELRERVQAAETHRLALEGARSRAKLLGETMRETARQLEEAHAHHSRAVAGLEAGRARQQRLQDRRRQLLGQQQALRPLERSLGRLERAGLLDRIQRAQLAIQRSEVEQEQQRAIVEAAREELSRTTQVAVDLRQLAGVLSSHLQGPCLVCGSEDHPAPAEPVDLDAVLERLEARSKAMARLEGALAELEHRTRATQERRDDLEGLLDRIPADLPRSPGILGDMLERLALITHVSSRALERTDRQTRGLQSSLDEARHLVDSAHTAVQALETQQARDQRDLHDALALEGTAWGAMNEALGDMTLFDLPNQLTAIRRNDAAREALGPQIAAAEKALGKARQSLERRRDAVVAVERDQERADREVVHLEDTRTELLALVERAQTPAPARALQEVEASLKALEDEQAAAQAEVEASTRAVLVSTREEASAAALVLAAAQRHERATRAFQVAMERAALEDVPEAALALPDVDLDARERALDTWFQQLGALELAVQTLQQTAHPPVEEQTLRAAEDQERRLEAERRDVAAEHVRADELQRRLKARASRFASLSDVANTLSSRADRLGELTRLLRGDRFVEFVANDFLSDLVSDATDHLTLLTRGRYALDLDDAGAFLVIDRDAGDARRPASSLSGGETFLASLALALALSTQVQRHNSAALEFFFLDEGFGSLDPESLDRVMSAIETLSADARVIGLISHVSAVRERVPRRLELHCPRDGTGTVVRYREA